MKFNKDYKIFLTLILILSIFSAISVYLPQGNLISVQELPASKNIIALVNFSIMFFIYGGLGLLGLKLSKKIGFANIWDKKVSNYKRFVQPLIIGSVIGIFFILLDLFISNFHSLGTLPHPPFPLSLVASVTAAIGEEIIARLFFISLWVWIILRLSKKGKDFNYIFWTVSFLSAIVFTIMHIPSIFAVYGFSVISSVPIVLLIELFVLNGSLSLFAAYNLRKYGFLAAVGVHFWADVVWHVVWGRF